MHILNFLPKIPGTRTRLIQILYLLAKSTHDVTCYKGLVAAYKAKCVLYESLEDNGLFPRIMKQLRKKEIASHTIGMLKIIDGIKRDHPSSQCITNANVIC